MKRIATLALIAVFALGAFASANAATEVKMTGDARIYGVFFAQHNFTGWNSSNWTGSSPTAWRRAGTQTEDRFQIWERFRLRSDFVANEAVKFRLGIKVEDTWGHGTLTAANPEVAIAVYQAYLQFKLPDCNTEVTAGLQDIDLPQSAMFYSSPVFGGDRMAALTVKTELIDKTLGLLAGFGRLIDTNRTYDTTTTQKADEFDLYFLALPITLDGFKATPWGAIGVAGDSANYWSTGFGQNLVSAGTFAAPTLWKNGQNAYWWAGSAFEVTALDPVKFYADVIYGAGAMDERKKNKRQGWFMDAGVEYTGWDVLTPQVFGWWSTGEDSSTRNGSERMPMVRPNWGAGNSFLFDTGQELAKEGNMGVSPVGNWGLGASLNNISFIEKLTHRLTFTLVRGNNDPAALRYLNTLVGSNPYFTMGRDLAIGEQVMSVNFDNKYMIYENLAAVMETGWAHGDFKSSVWGHRLAEKSRSGDAWKVAFGLTYKF
ncbi:outer membrane homotrimeric porin [Desulfovibrio aerotolerans]|uniref:Outer membrane homotrimeric porin n=1 Tax=Solidesulfovibrio aerotolerans TaxID=295255 RepID=A0A7C9J991_9BACT|nr:outer membrane homotrimeric porin [Solidesulfovibrio aerotolerans]MYL83358.1 outer membrane homotrimeric porin [Solidesulfovibrio aerotolerans]